MLFGADGVVRGARPTRRPTSWTPTGAGDSFSPAGVLGYLALRRQGPGGPAAGLRRAMAYGTVIASFTVEGFRPRPPCGARTGAEIEGRLEGLSQDAVLLDRGATKWPAWRNLHRRRSRPGHPRPLRGPAGGAGPAPAPRVKWVEQENLHVTLLSWAR